MHLRISDRIVCFYSMLTHAFIVACRSRLCKCCTKRLPGGVIVILSCDTSSPQKKTATRAFLFVSLSGLFYVQATHYSHRLLKLWRIKKACLQAKAFQFTIKNRGNSSNILSMEMIQKNTLNIHCITVELRATSQA